MVVGVAVAELPPSDDVASLRDRVVTDIEAAGQHMLAIMLGEGEWGVSGAEVRVKIAKPQSLLEMSFGPDARKAAAAAASAVLRRPAKVVLVSGTPATNGSGGQNGGRPAAAAAPASGNRNRALEDPIVQRVREKFGAEVRTIVDHKNKR